MFGSDVRIGADVQLATGARGVPRVGTTKGVVTAFVDLLLGRSILETWFGVRAFSLVDDNEVLSRVKRIPVIQLVRDAAWRKVCGHTVIVTMLEVQSGWDGRHASHDVLTVALVDLPGAAAGRYDGISGRPVGISRRVSFPPGAPLLLESVELEGDMRLYTTADQDPVAARELLGPQLIDDLLDRPVLFDQRDDLLLVARRGSSSTLQFYDDLVADAVLLADHFASQSR